MHFFVFTKTLAQFQPPNWKRIIFIISLLSVWSILPRPNLNFPIFDWLGYDPHTYNTLHSNYLLPGHVGIHPAMSLPIVVIHLLDHIVRVDARAVIWEIQGLVQRDGLDEGAVLFVLVVGAKEAQGVHPVVAELDLLLILKCKGNYFSEIAL